MNERSDTDASEFAESLLRAAREERPTRADYERTLAVLTTGVAVGGALAAGSIAATAPKSSLLGSWLFVVAKWGSAVLAVPLVAGAALYAVPRWSASPPPRANAVASTAPRVVRAVRAKLAVSPVPTVDATELPVVDAEQPPDRSVGSSRAPQNDGLAAEVALLNRARAELRARDAKQALATLEEHRATFPRGSLGLEASVLSIEALLLEGRRAEATALGERLLETNPESPLAGRVRALLAR